MLMSGCFSSVSQVYRKRDRLDPGGDNRCDGAEHDRGCAYEPRWRRLQVRCRGESGESKNRAGEPLKARRVRAIGHLNFLGRWPATTRRGGIRNRADRRSAAVTRFANSRSRRCGSCISWAAATLNRETEHCKAPRLLVTGALAQLHLIGSRFRRSCHTDHVSHPNFVRVHLLQIWKPCWIEWRRRRLSGRVAAVKRGFSAGSWARFVVRRIRFPCHRVLPSYCNSDGSVQHVPSQWATLTLIASCGGSRFARSEAARSEAGLLCWSMAVQNGCRLPGF